MKVRILSFDFDGCLFNFDYYMNHYGEAKELGERNLIDSNAPLFSYLAKEKRNFDVIRTIIGSNRQSYIVDLSNDINENKDFRRGSCFPAIKEITSYLNKDSIVVFDPFLMADYYGNIGDGESFRRATDPTFRGEHANWFWDDIKFTLLFTQMQRMAVHYPNDEITFDFFDDKNAILSELYFLFSQSPSLIPSNIQLRLHSYAGDTVNQCFTIKGLGNTAEDYRRTITEMISIFLKDEDFDEKNLSEILLDEKYCLTSDIIKRNFNSIKHLLTKNDVLADPVAITAAVSATGRIAEDTFTSLETTGIEVAKNPNVLTADTPKASNKYDFFEIKRATETEVTKNLAQGLSQKSCCIIL